MSASPQLEPLGDRALLIRFGERIDPQLNERATALANAAVRAGRPTAVVDADTGQSDIGPPATVPTATAAMKANRQICAA